MELKGNQRWSDQMFIKVGNVNQSNMGRLNLHFITTNTHIYTLNSSTSTLTSTKPQPQILLRFIESPNYVYLEKGNEMTGDISPHSLPTGVYILTLSVYGGEKRCQNRSNDSAKNMQLIIVD